MVQLKSRYKELPLQNIREHDAFLKILREERVRSYLEIGSMHGGSLWRVAMALPKGSRLVSVDSMVDRPDAKQSLLDCVAELKSIGYDARFICGDSTDKFIVDTVKLLSPFGALFIDGNHSPDYVRADWKNYGPMARIVGFHDINWKKTWSSARGNTPPADGSTMGAPKMWDDLKRSYRHEEFRFHPSNDYYGIGVLWR